MTRRDLRAVAESKARTSGYPARMALFMESLDVDDRAAVDELLFGVPRISNRVVAETLTDEFADNVHVAKGRVTTDEVLRWRAKHET